MKTAFRALVRKDVQLFLVDRRALLMSFAIPIAIWLILWLRVRRPE